VLVQPGEHFERRVTEAPSGALAAEPPVQAADGGAHLPAEVALPGAAGGGLWLLSGCACLHRSLIYLRIYFVYLNRQAQQ
jgi:hypothetical protein